MEPTIKYLEITGDHYALGQQLGRASAAFMHERLVHRPGWKKVQARRGTKSCRAMEAAARRHFPQYVLEIEGLAAGAELPFEAVFAWHCRYELLALPCRAAPQRRDDGGASYATTRSLENTGDACTTLAVPTREGVLLAHNEDGMAAYDGHCLWVQAHPDEGLGYSGFHYPGLICGNCFFVNAAGLVQSTNAIVVRRRPAGVPRHIIVRALVDAATTQEVFTLLGGHDRASGCHHMVAQVGAGSALSIEAPAAGCSVLSLEQPYAHSNHLIHEAFLDLEQRISPSSVARLARAQALLANLPDRVACQDVVQILADEEEELPIYRRDPQDREGVRTLATVTFQVGRDGVAWAVYGNPLGPPLYRGTQLAG
jgi:hypothetical protein